LLVRESTKSINLSGVVRLSIAIIVISFSIELIAAFILTLHWADKLGWQEAVVIILSFGIVLLVSLLLTITEHSAQYDFLAIVFEATSAFGTLGLSTGLTPDLSPLGKIIIIITMFIGRLGPLTFAFALSLKSTHSKIRYPESNILIG
jgi:trk system potassium uptake protein TrkH